MQGEPIIAVVGLGYVGLPLAAAFGKTGWTTYGYDVNAERIKTLTAGTDWTHELTPQDLQATKVVYSNDSAVIGKANTIIVAVPTPVDAANVPDLALVRNASQNVGKHMTKGSVIVFESTVYPGVTEDMCVPILEKTSGLACGPDFTVGYSPERINPGDKEHTIDKIVKVVAGQNAETTAWLKKVYGKIATAGIYEAANIKAAELAKALENTQRDINIALMNEIARLCDELGIRTKDVLDAAGTKWNFLKFTPGLVGGHCIGIDPYYLVYKARELGMETDVIAAGRKMNDTQTAFIHSQIVRGFTKSQIDPKDARVLVLGLTFKENVPDTRNAKVHELIRKLSASGCNVEALDPWLTPETITQLGFTPGSLHGAPYDLIVAAVSHREYAALTPADLQKNLKRPGILYDARWLWDPNAFDKDIVYLSL